MPIQFGGLASGLDVESIINSLSSIEQKPIQDLGSSKSLVDQAVSTLGTFTSKLSALRSAAQALKDPKQFASFTATSTETSAVTASIFGAAASGSYDVSVTALAREQKTFTDPQSSSTSALGYAGSLTMTINGVVTNVTVKATDSLADLAANINGSGARANAAVIYDGTNYRLQVRGLDTGATNAITFAENGFSLGLNASGNQYQTAQDAAFKVDGVSITRATNSVVGVIPGVTLALTNLTNSAKVNVAADPTALQSKVNAFVSAYNAVVQLGQQTAGYGTQKAQNTELAGDASIRTVLGRLSGLLSAPINGTSGLYSTLGAVGVASTKDGVLQLNGGKLSTALSADPTAVAKVFVTDASQGATGVMDSFITAINSMIDSPSSVVAARISGLQTKSRGITKRVDEMQARLDTYTTRLRAQFTAMDQTVSAYKAQGNAITNFLNSNSNSNK
jgi:flagellar hook-associated protein 2